MQGLAAMRYTNEDVRIPRVRASLTTALPASHHASCHGNLNSHSCHAFKRGMGDSFLTSRHCIENDGTIME